MSRSWKILLIVVLSGIALVLLPCMQQVRNGEGYIYSQASLKPIGLAIQAYHDAYKRLPPGVVYSKDGKPLYSWRVLLLPFLEENQLYRKFKLEEPWDSPDNKKLLEETPRCYLPFAPLDDPPGFTRYQAITGLGTAFEGKRLTFKDFSDDRASTMLVAEAAQPVPWSKPVDLAYDPESPLPDFGGCNGKPDNCR
jgi:hypothetical protein